MSAEFRPDGLTVEAIDALIASVDHALSVRQQPPRLVPDPELDERRARRRARRSLALIAGAGRDSDVALSVRTEARGEAA